jgi:enoyl-CoA hydratase/carnithine racemase
MGERIVQSTANGPIAVLTLDRPKALNALNGLLMEQLAAALEAADADPQVRRGHHGIRTCVLRRRRCRRS